MDCILARLPPYVPDVLWHLLLLKSNLDCFWQLSNSFVRDVDISRMLKIFSLSEVMLTLHLYLQLLQKEKKIL